jgi:hypothetical protein
MATKQQQEGSSNGIVESLRSSYSEAIESYDRQAKEALAQGESAFNGIPVVRQLAGIQADLARIVVDVQTWGARQLVGA